MWQSVFSKLIILCEAIVDMTWLHNSYLKLLVSKVTTVYFRKSPNLCLSFTYVDKEEKLGAEAAARINVSPTGLIPLVSEENLHKT